MDSRYTESIVFILTITMMAPLTGCSGSQNPNPTDGVAESDTKSSPNEETPSEEIFQSNCKQPVKLRDTDFKLGSFLAKVNLLVKGLDVSAKGPEIERSVRGAYPALTESYRNCLAQELAIATMNQSDPNPLITCFGTQSDADKYTECVRAHRSLNVKFKDTLCGEILRTVAMAPAKDFAAAQKEASSMYTECLKDAEQAATEKEEQTRLNKRIEERNGQVLACVDLKKRELSGKVGTKKVADDYGCQTSNPEPNPDDCEMKGCFEPEQFTIYSAPQFKEHAKRKDAWATFESHSPKVCVKVGAKATKAFGGSAKSFVDVYAQVSLDEVAIREHCEKMYPL